ncbi:MAG: hypothetical protein CSA62_13725 [Planctomycetota bacterium]|nr:MAG: hypothetical protein CSA62_13725 [Planctomycetota bacterium]
MSQVAAGAECARGRPVFWLLALLWRGVIFAASSVEGGGGGEKSFLFIFLSNGMHAAVHGILAFFIALAVPRSRGSLLVALLMTVVLGASDEMHQFFVPGRTPSFLDWCTDIFGALFGVLARLWLSARREERPLLWLLLGLSVLFASATALAESLH